MANERTKQPRLAITVIAVAAVMLVAATTEMAITGYVFAYNRNQAKSDVNECGNGQVPTNIGCQNIDSQIQGDENSVALTSQQTFPSVTREPPSPPEPTGFTVEGTGKAITGPGEGQTVLCKPPLEDSTIAGITLDLDFLAQSDGTVSGTYKITATYPPDIGGGFVIEGTITDGTTDGNTYSLTGEGESLCPIPLVTVEVTFNGNCGDDVTINYDENQASGTFPHGSVDCTLTF